eukprot:7615648-Alexandrium_andersonii.AAC.1
MGVGVFCPSEAEVPVGLGREILDFVESERRQDGFRAWAAPTGVMPSSTRAEIVGLMTACFADGPARVGIDN